jgi:hypothetical protein
MATVRNLPDEPLERLGEGEFFFFSPYSLYNQSVWQTLSTSCENDLFLETNTYTIT